MEEELSGYLTALSTIRQQLRARRVEDRQTSLATGLLTNQRQEEQQLMAMVDELCEGVRVLREQCRRLQEDFASDPPTQSAPSTSSTAAPPANSTSTTAPPSTSGYERATARDFAHRHAASGGVPLPPGGRASTERLPLDANDLHFHSEQLLSILLTEAAKRSVELVEEAGAAVSTPTKSPVKALPAVKLLVLVQRDLYRKASMATAAKEPIVATFIEYVRKLIEHCQAVLHKAATQGGRFNNSGLDSPLSHCLYRSIVGSALPITVTTLHSLLFKPTFQSLSHALFPALQSLMGDLNTVAALFPSSHAMDREDSTRLPMSSTNLRIVESPHSYLPSTDDESIVTVPGADFLSLDFDPPL